MNKQQIVSTLEGQKPTASIYKVENGGVLYRTTITNRTKKIPETQPIFFHIPFNEIKEEIDNTVKVEDIIQWLI